MIAHGLYGRTKDAAAVLCFEQVDYGTLEGCFCRSDSQAIRNTWGWGRGGTQVRGPKKLRSPNLGMTYLE